MAQSPLEPERRERIAGGLLNLLHDALGKKRGIQRSGIVQTPPEKLDAGKADSRKYTGTVITAYNDAEKSMPETFSLLKHIFKDKGRSVERIDDPAATADFVVTVGSKTEKLKP